MYLFDYIEPDDIVKVNMREAIDDDLPDAVFMHVHADHVNKILARFKTHDTVHFKKTKAVWTREDLSVEEFKLRLMLGDYENDSIFEEE